MKNQISKNATTFKIAILAIAVAVATMVGFGIFSPNQAKAETNNKIIATTTRTDIVCFNCIGWEAWSVETEPLEQKSLDPFYPGSDLLSTFASGHTVTKVKYSPTNYPGSKLLNLIFYDNNNQERHINLVASEYEDYFWTLDNTFITPGHQSLLEGDDLIVDHEFNYTIPKTTFDISGTITTTENIATPIPEASVQYLDKNRNVVDKTKTNENGYFTLIDISVDTLDGYLVIEHRDYETTTWSITAEGVEAGEYNNMVIPMPRAEDDEVNYSIVGGEHHVKFVVTMTATAEGRIDTEEFTFDKLEGDDLALGTTYKLDENGHLIMLPPEEESEVESLVMDVNPVCDDGYVVDKWTVDGSDLVVGETYTITDDIEGVVTYKMPTKTAQTGDAIPLAAVALSVITLVAGAALLRKSFK